MKVKDLTDGFYEKVVFSFRSGWKIHTLHNIKVMETSQQKYLLKSSEGKENRHYSLGEGTAILEALR